MTILLIILSPFAAHSIYLLMCDRYDQRRLERCGLDYYMPKHLLQKQLYALHGDPFHG